MEDHGAVSFAFFAFEGEGKSIRDLSLRHGIKSSLLKLGGSTRPARSAFMLSHSSRRRIPGFPTRAVYGETMLIRWAPLQWAGGTPSQVRKARTKEFESS